MAETEKITINLGAVDLGKIDLLVEHGHYSNRTDFIKTAIRAQLDKHSLEVQQSLTRAAFVVGMFVCTKDTLEARLAKGEKLKIQVMGMLHIHSDVPASLAAQVIESVKLYGIFNATDEVKAALADRMN